MPIDATQPYDESNIFARILRGEVPSSKVYEDEHALAFNDIMPQAPIHILVIPKGRTSRGTTFRTRSDAEIAGFVAAVGRSRGTTAWWRTAIACLPISGGSAARKCRTCTSTFWPGGRSARCSRADRPFSYLRPRHKGLGFAASGIGA
jgi:hypothetical protein